MGGGYEGDAFQGAFYENPGNTENNWITIKLEGTKANKCAIGSKVKLTVQNPDNSTRDIHLWVGDGGSFGVNSMQLETGIGKAIAIKQIEVTWQGPDTKQIFTDIPVNGFIKLTEGEDTFEKLAVNTYRLNTEMPSDSTMMHHNHEM
jgi:hypothetical protein